MTELGDVVYVVGRRSSIIKTFSVDTLSPVGEDIHVNGMRRPRDIVARDGHLYVADYECIWRVSVDDHSYVKWLWSKKVNALSVTSRGLLVTSSSRFTPPSSLREYNTTDRQLLRDVKLPVYVDWLFHGVETSRGTFIISHFGTSEDWMQMAVSELLSCHHMYCHE